MRSTASYCFNTYLSNLTACIPIKYTISAYYYLPFGIRQGSVRYYHLQILVINTYILLIYKSICLSYITPNLSHITANLSHITPNLV